MGTQTLTTLVHLLTLTHNHNPPLLFTVNVALNKPAFQSGGDTVTAARAVDGNTDPNNPNTCTFIDTGEANEEAWWYVDLGQEFLIETITVYNTDNKNGKLVVTILC